MENVINILVGGFNPFEKYARQIGSSPQGSGVKNKTYLSCHHLQIYHSHGSVMRCLINPRHVLQTSAVQQFLQTRWHRFIFGLTLDIPCEKRVGSSRYPQWSVYPTWYYSLVGGVNPFENISQIVHRLRRDSTGILRVPCSVWDKVTSRTSSITTVAITSPIVLPLVLWALSGSLRLNGHWSAEWC